MRIKQVIFSLVLTICLCLTAAGQQAARIESMKLLTTDTGWATTRNKLFWTTDGGASWKDTTPKLNHKGQFVSSVFFLNSSTGWVLLKCSDGRNPIADDACFEFASTNDSGESWSTVQPKIVDPAPKSAIEDGQGFSNTTFLNFVDSQHGWAILKKSYGTQRSVGEMLRTVDGGKTWTQLPHDSLPIADHFLFMTASVGWIAGGGQPESDLYVTHDAGNTWNQVVVPPPSQVKLEVWPPTENGVWPDYKLPIFESAHGFLIGRYWDGQNPTPVLFSTNDLGQTWTFERILPKVEGIVTIVNGTLIAVSTPESMDKLTFTRLPLSGKAAQPASVIADVYGIALKHYNLGAGYDALSIVNDARGWLLADELLSTSDGGVTWIDVTPGGPPPTLPSSHQPTKTAPSQIKGGSVNRGSAQQPATGSNVSAHLGFDKSDVVTKQQMQTLMTSSPFYDTYIYLPGSPKRHVDSTLTKAWVTAIEGQGWGIIPIWFGLQSTCANNTKNITQFISTTPATASTQGAEQAEAAVSADTSLGIAGGIIYLDIENYTVGGTCSAAVQAYVDGFVSDLTTAYSGYLAGVYANPGPIKSDISQVSPAPNAIWITKTPASGNPPQVTIWNQGINDSLWPISQRMHQFLIDQTGVTWGGVSFSPSVDEDINYGPVVNANAIAKTYTYGTPTTIDCDGAIETVPLGINDMNGSALINGPGQMGAVVGYYQTAIGSPITGFENIGGDCTPIPVFGSTYVEAVGINNLGQIVGYFEDSNGAFHGFLQNSGGKPAQIDYSGGGQTYLYGINDAGQAVGFAYSPSTFYYQSFMYYGGRFYPLGFSGNFQYTLASAINGDAVLTGEYYYEPTFESFTLAATPSASTPPSWGGNAIGLSPNEIAGTIAHAIDSNNELAGLCDNSSGCTNTQAQCGFVWTRGLLLDVLQYGGDANVVYGMNDFAQAVRPSTNSVTQYSSGLLWTHQ